MDNASSSIASGKLSKLDTTQIPFQLLYGRDITLTQQCDIQWGTFNIKTLEYIKQNIPEDQLEKVLQSLQLEDSHWNWFKKSLYYNQEGYEWFYLLAEDEIQGMCLVYQPKKSVINTGEIYYIEYLAVAPWNRDTLISKRKYLKVATTMLALITKFLQEVKFLSPAFSLHSLPQATGFYEHLGMRHYPSEDKDGLKFFEIPIENAKQLMEVHQ